MNKSTLIEYKIDEEVKVQLLINELRENNIINWIKEVMHLKNQKNLEAISNSMQNQYETTHQKIWKITRQKLRRITRSNSNSLRTIWVRSQQSINVIYQKKKVQFSKQYNEYKKLFEKNEKPMLSKHKS